MGSLYITCYKYLTPPESLLPRTHIRLKDIINPIERKHGNKLNLPTSYLAIGQQMQPNPLFITILYCNPKIEKGSRTIAGA